MPDFWIDTDALMNAKNRGYSFEVAPEFWDLLLGMAANDVLRAPLWVQTELREGNDKLAEWAKEHSEFFCDPSEHVQAKYHEIADYVRGYYDEAFSKDFLKGADAWHIAHACCEGGQIVTGERESRQSPAPKNGKARIPDVAKVFGVQCLSMDQMLIKAGVKISFSR